MIYYSLINIPREFGSFSMVKSDPLITEVFSHLIDRVIRVKKHIVQRVLSRNMF